MEPSSTHRKRLQTGTDKAYISPIVMILDFMVSLKVSTPDTRKKVCKNFQVFSITPRLRNFLSTFPKRYAYVRIVVLLILSIFFVHVWWKFYVQILCTLWNGIWSGLNFIVIRMRAKYSFFHIKRQFLFAEAVNYVQKIVNKKWSIFNALRLLFETFLQ